MGKRPLCQGCRDATYIEKYDSYACLTCNEWVEPLCTCQDGECPFEKRPMYPIMGEILVTVEGGVVQQVDNIPKGITVKVMDFDTDGVEKVLRNEKGEAYVLSTWE